MWTGVTSEQAWAVGEAVKLIDASRRWGSVTRIVHSSAQWFLLITNRGEGRDRIKRRDKVETHFLVRPDEKGGIGVACVTRASTLKIPLFENEDDLQWGARKKIGEYRSSTNFLSFRGRLETTFHLPVVRMFGDTPQPHQILVSASQHRLAVLATEAAMGRRPPLPRVLVSLILDYAGFAITPILPLSSILNEKSEP